MPSPETSKDVEIVDSEQRATKDSEHEQAHEIEIEEIPRLRKEQSLEITMPKNTGFQGSSGWFVGNGTFGQLGTGTNRDSRLPVPLSLQESVEVTRIAVGSSHSMALSPEGKAFCFGLNDSGQCALKTSAADVVLSPLATSLENDMLIRSTKVVDAACGGQHTAAITDGGELITWGNSEHGQCGHDSSNNTYIPRLVRALKDQFVSQVACGDSHTLILTSTSSVFSCGLAMYHALGHGDDVDVASPKAIRALWSLPVIQVAAGEHHSAALLSTGAVYLWGRNNQGQVGKSAPSFDRAELGTINQQMLSILLEMGYEQSVAEEALLQTKSSGVDACVDWLHVHRKEGHDAASTQRLPARCAGVAGVQSIACGGSHSVAITGDGVYSWGAGGSGQLGHGGREDEAAPRAVAALAGRGVCEAACGYSHTLFRTEEGRLLACGSNEFGQLLMGVALRESEGVVDVSSALEASLSDSLGALPPPAFSPSTPRLDPVPAKPASRLPPQLKVRTLAAGGQTSAVTVGVSPPPPPASRMQHFALLGRAALARLRRLIADARHAASEDALDQLLEQTNRLFRSAAALTAVCADESGDGVRFSELEELYTALLPSLGTAGTASMVEAIAFLLSDMIDHLASREGVSHGTTSCARAALAVAHSPLMEHPVLGGSLMVSLCKVLNLFDRATTQQLVVWWSKCPSHILLRRVVQPLNAFISARLEQTQSIDIRLIHAVVALDLAHRANQLSRSPLIETCFVNDFVSNQVALETDYIRWRQAVGVLSLHPDQDPYPVHRQNFAFCSFAFLLDEAAKARLLHVEAQVMQQQEQMMSMGVLASFQGAQTLPAGMTSREQVASSPPRKRATHAQGVAGQASAAGGLLPAPEDSGLPATHVAFCILRMRRTHLLQDALQEICRQKKSDLFKPLKVCFVGEEGVDEGGLTKEFFSLITEKLFDPTYGMFHVQEETGVLWFNPGSLESATEFMIIGLLLSLAVYNRVLLDVPLFGHKLHELTLELGSPRVLWKKLLEKPLNQADLSDLSPEVADGLDALLSYDGPGSVEDVFCLTFEAGYTFCGQQRSYELKAGGADIPVTNANRREYVQLYVDHILSSSIQSQFEAFKTGFLAMFHPTGLLRLLSPRELEALVCGSPTLDFYKLQNVAKYGAGYTSQSQVIEWFWQVVHEMSEEDKKKLLKFVTGNDRSPIGGMSKLNFVIQRQGPDSMQLPTSHTCFNVLLLPEYTSRGKLRDRVMTAIANAEGFGLK